MPTLEELAGPEYCVRAAIEHIAEAIVELELADRFGSDLNTAVDCALLRAIMKGLDDEHLSDD